MVFLTPVIYSESGSSLSGFTRTGAVLTNIPMTFFDSSVRVLTGTPMTTSSEPVYLPSTMETAEKISSNLVTPYFRAVSPMPAAFSQSKSKKMSLSESGCLFGRLPRTGISLTGMPSANISRKKAKPFSRASSVSLSYKSDKSSGAAVIFFPFRPSANSRIKVS